jgi:hypothetical protein
MGSERCSLLHRHPAAGVGGLEMAVGFQNSKFLSVHFFSIYHTGVYPKYQGRLTFRCEVPTFWRIWSNGNAPRSQALQGAEQATFERPNPARGRYQAQKKVQVHRSNLRSPGLGFE